MTSHRSFGSTGDEVYANREDAGRRLSSALEDYRDKNTLVLGIPRGGVPVAAAVARAIHAELDIIVARKLGAPYQPELAIGAVTANGGLFLDHEMISDLRVSDAYLEGVIDRESAVALQREVRFRGETPAPRIAGRTVIVVDDGLATGATMRAAVRSVRKQQPGRLIVAVPVGSIEACNSLRAEVDEVVCPVTPQQFYAVGLHYRDFLPTEDADVEEILAEFHRKGASGTSATPVP